MDFTQLHMFLNDEDIKFIAPDILLFDDGEQFIIEIANQGSPLF